jgi:hypothetical protein
MKRTAMARTRTPMKRPAKRMTQEKPETASRRRAWRLCVFEMWGDRCWFGNRGFHEPTRLADHPAHILKRSRMGAAIAYGPKRGEPDPRLGRPLCAECHGRQEPDTDPAYRFSLADRIEATIAHNENSCGVVQWPIPTE